MPAATILTLAAALALPDPVGHPYTNAQVGVSVTLPDASWAMTDRGQGAATVLVFSPDADFSRRCTILHLPAPFLPMGLTTREMQIKAGIGDGYQRIARDDVALAGHTWDRLEYHTPDQTTVEVALPRDSAILIVQVSAPDTLWAEPAGRAMLEAMIDSIALQPPQAVVPDAPLPPHDAPDVIRARRAEALARPPAPFEVTRHEMVVDIEPDAHTLKAVDRLHVRAREAAVHQLTLNYSEVAIDAVEAPGGATFETTTGLAATQGWDGRLQVTLDTPLAAGAETVITVTTSSAEYFTTVDQQLVQEIEVIGQVRGASSFSTHVGYYPTDAVNDAAMDITLVVPQGHTAVTGGNLISQTEQDGRVAFRYRTDVRVPRLLPFGFAVGRYISRTTTSDGGLELTVYGYPGEEALIDQRGVVARDSANIFEKMMGPLPWNAVRMAHVKPERKETGVSLPGLIVISDGFFQDFANVDLSDGNLARPDALSLMVITDELSHQWNFYAVPLPNELAEGVSTFTNLLYIEHRHDAAAYRRGMAFCKDAYLKSILIGRDHAIGDPAIYGSAAYRGVVFCKTPLVLDMLRTRLGDDVFFKSWRTAFTQFDRDIDGFEILQRAFSHTSGQDLRSFFDAWFFRPGYPRIAVDHALAGETLTVTLRQTQPDPPFPVDATIELRGTDGQTRRHAVSLRERTTVTTIATPFPVSDVVFDPDGHVLYEPAPTPTG